MCRRRRHAGIRRGDVDERAAASDALAHQRGQNVLHRVQRSGECSLATGLRPGGVPLLLSWMEEAVGAHVGRQLAGERIHHLTVRGNPGIRTAHAEPRVLAVHDARTALLLTFVADAELVAGAGDEPVDEDVRSGVQVPEHRLALRQTQVDRDAALVAVELHVGTRVLRRDLAADDAQVVAPSGGFNLDHVGPEITEEHPEVVAVA